MSALDASSRSKPVTILLIEDDDAEAKAIRRAFARGEAPFPIVRVTDGIEALEMLRAQPVEAPGQPLIILADLGLPRMDGHEFLTELRADPALMRHVVFVLSTSDAPEDISRAQARNIAGFIVRKQAGVAYERLVAMLRPYVGLVALPAIEAA